MITRHFVAKSVGLAVFLGLWQQGHAATTGNTINIVTGQTITRTWADVVAASYAYAPKQSYDAATSTTHIWLPYGNTDGVYYQLQNITFANPTAASASTISSSIGSSSTLLSYKFEFDQAISQFTFSSAWGYFTLQLDGTDTIAGQFLYSTDGATWQPFYTLTATGQTLAEPLVNATVTGLNTTSLYIAVSTSNLTNSSDTSGGTRYLQMRTSGAGNWGESSFYSNQWDLYVVTAVPEPASLTLAGLLAGFFLSLRRR